jgi:hypothetical protein
MSESDIVCVLQSDDDFLLQKIKQIVAYDLGSSLSGRNLLPDNNISKSRFEKQVTRLYEACKISETDRQYIFERIIELN